MTFNMDYNRETSTHTITFQITDAELQAMPQDHWHFIQSCMDDLAHAADLASWVKIPDTIPREWA